MIKVYIFVNQPFPYVPGDKSLHKLLSLLPLLRSDNVRVKDVYVSAAPALVQRCVDAPRRASAPDLCRQLLSYLLVHPALTHTDQRYAIRFLFFMLLINQSQKNFIH